MQRNLKKKCYEKYLSVLQCDVDKAKRKEEQEKLRLTNGVNFSQPLSLYNSNT